MTNPWGLTDAEVDTILESMERINDKDTARSMGLHQVTIRERFARIRAKMGVKNRLMAAVMFDRYMRGSDAQG